MVSFTYENLVDLIRNIANSVNPTGTFVHARRSDGSLEYDGAMPQIHLYPFTLRGTDTKETDLLIAFWQQDSPASSNEEREAIIQEMDVLSRTFMETLDDYETLEILGFNGEPQYRQLAGTLSGFAVRFTIRGGIDCEDTPLPVPPSCPTLCERISDATAAEILHCMDAEQEQDMQDLVCSNSCTYEIIANGVSEGSVTLINCEDLTINVP